MQSPKACQDYSRSKGRMHMSGKIYKGCLKPASTKLIVSSIPTHYQNVVYANNNQRGFGTSQTRFRKDIPDFKEIGENNSKFYQQPQYKSLRKGYGPLKSKTDKFSARNNKSPGPGTYYNRSFCDKTSNQIVKTNKRKLKIQSSKNTDFKTNSVDNDDQNPGPGYYSIEQTTKWNKSNLKGWKSSFTSKGTRDTYLKKNKNPGPGFYHQDVYLDAITRDFPGQRYNQAKIQAQTRKIIRKNKPLAQIPGPGSYNTNIPSFKPFYDTIKVSKNFVSGKKTRFGQDQAEYRYLQYQDQNSPSPCSYNIKSIFDDFAQQKMIQSSFFMSQSKRIAFQAKEGDIGPTKRLLESPKKQYHFNIRQKWL